MIISGFQKLTLLDYPNKTACLLFTQGCNFKCPFCHNKSLLENSSSNEVIDEEEIFKYLDKRKNVLDGVCISGGEPLLQKNIEIFIKKIKEKGFLVKLDTNGSFPGKLKWLIDNNLVDYVAMDIKNNFFNYKSASGIENNNIENIKKSISILENSNIEHEFRTTVVKEIHDLEQIESICKYIGVNTKYYLQNFEDNGTVLQKGLSGFEKKELQNIVNKLKNTYPNIEVR
ncbi:MAG: anaerobic ribonucleoside-triphosphate reductase activating protein [Firmicutes bacterium]|nr:anaerobic ribonucleoside-triphosphate reductase activating protein [Bacillota bacterium]